MHQIETSTPCFSCTDEMSLFVISRLDLDVIREGTSAGFLKFLTFPGNKFYILDTF